jgi:hypothetical protein
VVTQLCDCGAPKNSGFTCLDCEICTNCIYEYYMVTDDVWSQAHPKSRGMLCLGCLENRLGRKLTGEDFPILPVNSSDLFFQSERLTNRLQK